MTRRVCRHLLRTLHRGVRPSAAFSVAAPPMTDKTAKNLRCGGYRNRLILRGVVGPNADGQKGIFSGTIGRRGGARYGTDRQIPERDGSPAPRAGPQVGAMLR